MESNQLSTLFKSELMGFFLDQTALNASHYAGSLGRDKGNLLSKAKVQMLRVLDYFTSAVLIPP